jgi:hypothetical protein
MGTIDLSSLDAGDILNETALEYYKRGMDFFYLEQLVPLNVNLYILDKILQFPFALLVDPKEMIFFTRVVDNFIQASVLTITRLATDKGGDLFTITRFKNWVLENVRSQHREAVQYRLKQVKFDQATRIMAEKAKKLRDARFAHTKREQVFSLEEQDRLDFSELQRLCDALNALLDALSFNVGRLMLPLPYAPDVRRPPDANSRSDIERLLDGLARTSSLLNLPEKHPEVWAIRRQTLSPEALETINRYRVKLDLPKA